MDIYAVVRYTNRMKKLRLPKFSKFPFSVKPKKPQPGFRAKMWWLAVGASAVVVAFPYLAVHQNYRHGANDPQVQYAQDLSLALEQGASAEAFGGNSPVDPRKSLGLFLMAFGEDKAVLANTMQLEGDAPVPPQDILNAAKNDGQQRFSWQPRGDVRVAAVLQHYGGAKPGYLLVGRSLAEVDKRQQQLAFMALGAFAVLVALATIGVRLGAAYKDAGATVIPATPQRLTFDRPQQAGLKAAAAQTGSSVSGPKDARSKRVSKKASKAGK